MTAKTAPVELTNLLSNEMTQKIDKALAPVDPQDSHYAFVRTRDLLFGETPSTLRWASVSGRQIRVDQVLAVPPGQTPSTEDPIIDEFCANGFRFVGTVSSFASGEDGFFPLNER